MLSGYTYFVVVLHTFMLLADVVICDWMENPGRRSPFIVDCGYPLFLFSGGGAEAATATVRRAHLPRRIRDAFVAYETLPPPGLPPNKFYLQLGVPHPPPPKKKRAKKKLHVTDRTGRCFPESGQVPPTLPHPRGGARRSAPSAPLTHASLPVVGVLRGRGERKGQTNGDRSGIWVRGPKVERCT